MNYELCLVNSQRSIYSQIILWVSQVKCISQKHLSWKKSKPKKVQVTEQPKDVISLWGQEEKLYQLGCIYKTPAYKETNLNNYISCKLSLFSQCITSITDAS